MRSGHVAGFDAATPRPPATTSLPLAIIRARYDGHCWACDQPIEVGAMIAWRPGLPSVHEVCPAKSPTPPVSAVIEALMARHERAEYIAGSLNDRDEIHRIEAGR